MKTNFFTTELQSLTKKAQDYINENTPKEGIKFVEFDNDNDIYGDVLQLCILDNNGDYYRYNAIGLRREENGIMIDVFENDSIGQSQFYITELSGEDIICLADMLYNKLNNK